MKQRGRHHPEDDPARRHRELEGDHLVAPGQTFAGAELPGRRSASRLNAAALRLAALEIRELGEVSDAAAAGCTNWVQTGPAAIPNGQSLGGAARVLVTGRLTDIVVDPADPSVLYVAAAHAKASFVPRTRVPRRRRGRGLPVGCRP